MKKRPYNVETNIWHSCWNCWKFGHFNRSVYSSYSGQRTSIYIYSSTKTHSHNTFEDPIHTCLIKAYKTFSNMET